MPLFNIHVKDAFETLDYILEHNASAIRFGDGEIEFIKGSFVDYQERDPQLSARLLEIIQQESNPQRVICLVDIFERIERYNDFTLQCYQIHLERNGMYYPALCRAPWYGSAFISRPYIILRDKSQAKSYFDKLKQLWQDRDILIVEGTLSRSGVGNDLFANAKSIKRIICPSRNAYSRLPAIKQAIHDKVMNEEGKPRLVLLMLGPTAKVLAYDLSAQYQCIDIGHIDSEYEWFLRGVEHKVKFLNKHTAEYNYEEHDQEIVLEDDPVYHAQIVANVL